MRIGAYLKFSLIDYPGKVCAIIFTQGCNFRCPYCHNPELVNSELWGASVPEEEIFQFLKSRQGKLEAVEITGGEPTLQPDLATFLGKIKKLNYLVKLDSNGSRPEVLKKIIELGLVDYLAMDVKAPLEKYQEVTNSPVEPEKIRRSIEIIMNSGLAYEFRTTVVKSQLGRKDILKIGELIKGAQLYVLQKFVPSKVLKPEFIEEATYSGQEFRYLKNDCQEFVVECIVR
jgi:pyruvate formate lyase activating enzyme